MKINDLVHLRRQYPANGHSQLSVSGMFYGTSSKRNPCMIQHRGVSWQFQSSSLIAIDLSFRNHIRPISGVKVVWLHSRACIAEDLFPSSEESRFDCSFEACLKYVPSYKIYGARHGLHPNLKKHSIGPALWTLGLLENEHV